jgi:cyclic pyranopterin phosphate synthase
MGGFNDDEIPELLGFAAARGYEQRFIEFMPMASNGYGLDAEPVSLDEIRRRVETQGALTPAGRGSGPADVFVLEPTGQRVGIIAAISQPFCATCNRVRLTAEGVLRSCLFEGGEISVKAITRDGRDLRARLLEAFDWVRSVKPNVHEGVGHVQMNQVGG